jgi:hypothetical protein
MKRLMLAALTASTLSLLAPVANAQIGFYQRPQIGPYYRPPISPYLNILSRGGPGFGYYTQTRPQQQAFQSIGQLQTGVQDLRLLAQQGVGTSGLGGLPPSLGVTGHPVTFFNYGPYYTFPSPRFGPNLGGGGVGSPAGIGPGFGTNLLGAPPGGQRQPGITPFINLRSN